MSKLRYILILLLFNINLVYAYQVDGGMYSNRIGYTTNYGNTFKPSQLSEQPKQLYTTTQQYQGVYTPSTQANVAQVSQPRRASSVSSGEVDGVRWEIIAHINIFGEVGYYEIWIDGKYYDWYIIKQNAINAAIAEATRIANERAHASPIGDPIIPTLIISLAYLSYITVKQRKRKRYFL